MRLLTVEKKVLMTTAVSLGLVATIGFAAPSKKYPDSLNLVTLNTTNQTVPGTDQVTNIASAQGLSFPKQTPKASPQSLTSDKPQSISKAIPKSWLEQVQKDVAQREYNITWQDKTDLPKNKAAWQAPNRAHDFRTYFTDQGFTVVPRSGAKDWLWSLKLIARSEEHTSELQSH